MKRKSKKSPFPIPLTVVSVITVILGVVLLYMELVAGRTPPVSDGTEAEETEITVPAVLFESELGEYEKYMDVTDEKYLILVNKTHTIDGGYEPERLVGVKDANKNIELSVTAEKALEAMFTEMRVRGFTGVYVTSAYRSYDYQISLFNTYINDEISSMGFSYEEAREKVLTYSALPGTSEHHTGLCVDLMANGMTELDESFEEYPVFDWLSENAWKFGFVLRYPEDKTEITGYSYEPWHYRFVGRYHAYVMKTKNLCLEEYLETLEK